MLALRRWTARRFVALWLAAILLEVGLIAGIRAYGDAVFARERRAIIARAQAQGLGVPDTAHHAQATWADTTRSVRFDGRLRHLMVAQQAGVSLVLALPLSLVILTLAWGWVRVRSGARMRGAPPESPAPGAPQRSA